MCLDFSDRWRDAVLCAVAADVIQDAGGVQHGRYSTQLKKAAEMG